MILGRIVGKYLMAFNADIELDKDEDPTEMVDLMLSMIDAKAVNMWLAGYENEIARKQQALENALRAGCEGDARTLLAAKQSLESIRDGLQQKAASAGKLEYKGENKYFGLRLREHRPKVNITIARMQVRISGTWSEFDAVVVDTDDLTERCISSSNSPVVDDELAAIKAKLGL